jgi:hypothetical protein
MSWTFYFKENNNDHDGTGVESLKVLNESNEELSPVRVCRQFVPQQSKQQIVKCRFFFSFTEMMMN